MENTGFIQGVNNLAYSPSQPFINPNAPDTIDTSLYDPDDERFWYQHAHYNDEDFLDKMFANTSMVYKNGNFYGYLGDIARLSYEEFIKRHPEFDRHFGTNTTESLNTTDLDQWYKLYRQLYNEYLDVQEKYWNEEKDFNASQTDKVNQTLIDLAKNSIKYRVDDLKAAGINPLLAIEQLGGIDVPGLNAASASAPNFSYLNPSSLLSAETSLTKQNKDMITDIISSIAGLFKIIVGSYKKQK